VVLCKEFHLQPSEIDIMPFWEYSMFIDELNDRLKDENKKNEEQEKKYDINSYKSQMNKYKPPSNFSNFKMPKI
jgi:hypothetical protein